MTNADNRGEQRADEARRTDDSDLIERMEDAPSFGGVNGHNINQDIATRDDLKQEVGEGSVTRVRDSDKPEQANLPRFNQGSSNLS
ncbi:MAG: hypothetical protein M3N39_14880 [Pseudomonadota bacterium]|jgi:hypothetical protein|nr:hypothetical protein [Pseudomonadota bacterium]